MGILIDNDGVMTDPHELIAQHYRSIGYDVTRDDINHWDFGKLREITGQSQKQIFDVFLHVWENKSNEIKFMDDAVVDVTNWILKTYDSAIVTANKLDYVKPWLRERGVNTKYLFQETHKEKLNSTIYIEDNPTLIIPHNNVLLMRDNPWNKNAVANERFDHFSKLPNLIDKYKGYVSHR